MAKKPSKASEQPAIVPETKLGRKPVEYDEQQIKRLAMINCTNSEIASVLGCSVDTIDRRFADIVKEGREQGRMSLRRKMWEMAQGGNVAMAIWLSKQMLGYREHFEVSQVQHKEPMVIELQGGGKIISGDPAEVAAKKRELEMGTVSDDGPS